MQYLEKYWRFSDMFSPNFISIAAFCTRMNTERFKFGMKSPKFKVTACWKMHFLALLMRCLENYSTEFHQTFRIVAFWDKDERVSF